MKLSSLVLAVCLRLLISAQLSQAQTVTVYWNNADQVIDGFGASSAFEPGLTSAQGTFFFSTDSGLGLSLLRTNVPDDGSCSTVNIACAGEVSDMRLAIANGARVWSTPWSPPASMKSNGSVNNGGSLLAGSYGAYAAYLANYVKSLNTLYGISLYALSVQNEPNLSVSFHSSVWTAANLDTFIRDNLGPEFSADGLTSTFIVIPESSGWVELAPLASATMADPTAAAYVGIIAWHDYDDAASVVNPFAAQGKKYWETEASAGVGFGPSLCGGCWDPSMADALMWAQIVNNRMVVANANSWSYWILINGHSNNAGLTGPDGVTIPKRAYMLGNYSKFVRPGFYRIDSTATPQDGVLVSAYKNVTTGALVIVVINQNQEDVSQSFTLKGITATSVTPWITSASLNLVRQSDKHVSGNGFTYTLPASSVTSFVANTTSVSTPSSAIAPPTRLTATIRDQQAGP
jgi:glucuronoarabinoxylan endo-1,4-beta-xylanase